MIGSVLRWVPIVAVAFMTAPLADTFSQWILYVFVTLIILYLPIHIHKYYKTRRSMRMFIEVTLDTGQPVSVHILSLSKVQPTDKGTKLFYTAGGSDVVSESYDEIKSRMRRCMES